MIKVFLEKIMPLIPLNIKTINKKIFLEYKKIMAFYIVENMNLY